MEVVIGLDNLEMELNVVRRFQSISSGILANYRLGPGMDSSDILVEFSGVLPEIEVRRLFADKSTWGEFSAMSVRSQNSNSKQGLRNSSHENR